MSQDQTITRIWETTAYYTQYVVWYVCMIGVLWLMSVTPNVSLKGWDRRITFVVFPTIKLITPLSHDTIAILCILMVNSLAMELRQDTVQSMAASKAKWKWCFFLCWIGHRSVGGSISPHTNLIPATSNLSSLLKNRRRNGLSDQVLMVTHRNT